MTSLTIWIFKNINIISKHNDNLYFIYLLQINGSLSQNQDRSENIKHDYLERVAISLNSRTCKFRVQVLHHSSKSIKHMKTMLEIQANPQMFVF